MNLAELIRRYKWDLGIALESEGHNYNAVRWNFHVVKAPFDRWFADPFILDVTENDIIVLVEELEHKTNKGRLAKLIIDKHTYKIKEIKIIFELSTHLSFPAIFRDGDKVYIYPENSASGSSEIYLYDTSKDLLKPFGKLSNKPLTDAIMLDLNGEHFLFSTRLPDHNSNILSIYRSSVKFTSYKLIQQIILEDNAARSAGDFLYSDNKIIRPAQNCNGGYGVGLVFQEVLYENGIFRIKELFRKNPPKGYIGMHTYNTYKGYAIVDLHTRRYPVVHRIFQIIKHLI